MTNAEAIEVVNGIILAAFTLGLLAAFASTGIRMLRLWLAGHKLPELIWRDFVGWGLLCFTFLLIAIGRAFEWTVREQLWWFLVTGAPAIAAVWVYVYFELFVIGHRRDRR